MKPIDGESKLKMELVDPKTIKTTCKIDHTLLEDAQRYRVTGRIGCFVGNSNKINLGLYESRYESLYE